MVAETWDLALTFPVDSAGQGLGHQRRDFVLNRHTLTAASFPESVVEEWMPDTGSCCTVGAIRRMALVTTSVAGPAFHIDQPAFYHLASRLRAPLNQVVVVGPARASQ